MAEQNPNLPFFPLAFDVEAGKTYHWCGCGQSQNQPLCDRSNCNQSVPYRSILTETVYFCACKETKDPPLCDGSHARLLRDYLKNHSK